MPREFFTSDLHFGHNNIIKYCSRPYKDITEMDVALIQNWNATVTDEDVVYVLGDFSLSNRADYIESIFHQLNGTKHLIKGNHDHKKAIKAVTWESVQELLDLTVDGTKVRLFHYPIGDWRGPTILLHGHRHSTADKAVGNFSYDVGVDANNYKPIQLSDIIMKVQRSRTW